MKTCLSQFILFLDMSCKCNISLLMIKTSVQNPKKFPNLWTLNKLQLYRFVAIKM